MTFCGGDIYIYELGVLISTPLDGDVDVHAFGAEPGIDALYHCIVTNSRAEVLCSEGMYPILNIKKFKKKTGRNVRRIQKVIEISEPFDPSLKRKVRF